MGLLHFGASSYLILDNFVSEYRYMKIYMKAAIITLVSGILVLSLFWYWQESTRPVQSEAQVSSLDAMESDGLPAFEAKRLDGALVKLSDFANKAVIVSFWASWCGPCLEEFPSMIELIEKTKGTVQLIAISQDSSSDEIKAFLKAFPGSSNPNIHILWDEDHSVGRLYNADRLPESFVADKQHKLVRKIVGSINWSTPEAIEYMKSISEK